MNCRGLVVEHLQRPIAPYDSTDAELAPIFGEARGESGWNYNFTDAPGLPTPNCKLHVEHNIGLPTAYSTNMPIIKRTYTMDEENVNSNLEVPPLQIPNYINIVHEGVGSLSLSSRTPNSSPRGIEGG